MIDSSSRWRTIAVLASFGAAGIHFGAAREHLAEYAPAGVFMLVIGVAQFGWALVVAHGAGERALEFGIAANAGAVALWIASRTIGLPIGPMPGEPEHIHGTDVLATVLEVLLIAAVVCGDRGARGSRWVGAVSMLAVVATVIVGGDDPARERLIAAATLVLAGAATAVSFSIPTFDPRRRSHETTFARPALLGLAAPVRAGGGARG